jgi:hypothetical protein
MRFSDRVGWPNGYGHFHRELIKTDAAAANPPWSAGKGSDLLGGFNGGVL